jgi:protease IV
MSEITAAFEAERLRKSRKRWRIFGILALVAIAAAIVAPMLAMAPRSDQIARITIDGVITGDAITLGLVESAAKADYVKAVIVRIDSPGGTTVGSEALYEAIRDLSAKKPVVAVMDSVAASGGYITALATDRILARGNTITGSIGVIFSYPDVSKLLDTLGVKMEEVKSGEFKAQPTPYKPMDERVRSVTSAMVMESYDWFLGLVSERRKLPADVARTLGDGRVYSGRQAVANKLIDALGGEDEAVAWLETEKGVAKDLDVLPWKRRAPFGNLGFDASAVETGLAALGLEAFGGAAERARLQGLLVLWAP